MNENFLGPKDVDMCLDEDTYLRISSSAAYAETDEIMIHYTVTESCPFNCRGCINALTAGVRGSDRSEFTPEENPENHLERDANGIAQLIERSGKKEAVLVFYGGEPMLRLSKMNRFHELLSTHKNLTTPVRYVVITSGHFLERAIERHPEMTSNLWLTAVSIDGTSEQHEAMRRGTSLETIRRQVAAFNRVRNGSVLIWSTIRPGMSLLDCFRSFMDFRERAEAEHFFWHCDEAEGVIPDLPGYLERYRSDLDRIMETYLAHIHRGDLLSIVHVNELILYFLTRKRRGSTACGVENMANFDIIGDGKIHACADLPQAMSIGRFSDGGDVAFVPEAKERLAGIIEYKADLGCEVCGIEPYCGGRCPVQAHTGGIERARQYCFMMREYVRTVKRYVAPVTESMVARGITLTDLYRSARYAKYTDVTP